MEASELLKVGCYRYVSEIAVTEEDREVVRILMSQVIPASTEVFQFTWKSQYDTGLEATNNVMEEEEEQEEQS